MLSIEKIGIYNKFGGDIEGLFRVGKLNEKKVIKDYEWSLIDEFEQDVHLISNRLVSKDYRERSLKRIIESCDLETKDFFTQKIPFYSDFQEVSELLSTIKLKIRRNTKAISAGFENVELLIGELDSYKKQIELLDFDILEKIKMEFLPTSSFQELAMSNGWSDKYIIIVQEFDVIYKRINKKLLQKERNDIGSLSETKESGYKIIWFKLKKMWS